MDLGDDVLAVHDDGLPLGGAESHMQDGPLLRDVDLLAPEHGLDAGPQAGFLRQLQKEPERLVGDPVLRIVQVDADGLSRQALPALRIGGEELPKMRLPHFPVMGFEGLPGREFREPREACRHAAVLSIAASYSPRRAAQLHLAR